MIRVKKPDDVPTGKHYAVIEFRSVTEASGWGPENDTQELCPHYYVTEDRDEWENHIKELEAVKSKWDRCQYVALVVSAKATIEPKITVITPSSW